TCIERHQLALGARDKCAKSVAIALAGIELRRQRGIVLRREPAADPLLLDRHGEGFVEYRVVLRVRNLMRELVEDKTRDLGIGIAEDRRQHGIVEITELRIRRNAADVDIVAAR